jgi:hypothetical protein
MSTWFYPILLVVRLHVVRFASAGPAKLILLFLLFSSFFFFTFVCVLKNMLVYVFCMCECICIVVCLPLLCIASTGPAKLLFFVLLFFLSFFFFAFVYALKNMLSYVFYMCECMCIGCASAYSPFCKCGSSETSILLCFPICSSSLSCVCLRICLCMHTTTFTSKHVFVHEYSCVRMCFAFASVYALLCVCMCLS